MEEFVVSSEEGASDEVRSIKKTKLTLIGKMSVVSAISRIKSSYFESIQEHGLVRGSKVAKDLAKKKLNYVDTALNKAKRMDQGRCAELYLTSQGGIGGNAFGKPSSVNRI